MAETGRGRAYNGDPTKTTRGRRAAATRPLPCTNLMGPTGSPRPTAVAVAASPRLDGTVGGTGRAAAARGITRRTDPVPMRPRGGFGAYLHDLRLLRGMTIRGLAAVTGLHHTYVSKLERGDRQAPDPRVVESLAVALAATPSQLDQLRWRAGHGGGVVPAGDASVPDPDLAAPEAPPAAAATGSTAAAAPSAWPVDPLRDPALTLLADALARTGDEAGRDALRRTVAAAVLGVQALPSGHPGLAGAPAPVRWPPVAGRPPAHGAPPLPIPHAPSPTGAASHVANVERFAGGILALEAAAAEIHVTPDYLWHLVQAGHLAAWVLPGTPVGSTAGVRVRREDLLGLLHPLAFTSAR